jgi:DNA-directed RNA polymerase
VGDKNDIDKAGAAQSVTANFVHSADAAHLQMVALDAAAAGIDLAAIHDCWGCVAPDALMLNYIIREAFYHLHSAHDLLAWVLGSARRDLPPGTELPPLPERGNLDLRLIRDSYHAFK